MLLNAFRDGFTPVTDDPAEYMLDELSGSLQKHSKHIYVVRTLHLRPENVISPRSHNVLLSTPPYVVTTFAQCLQNIYNEGKPTN